MVGNYCSLLNNKQHEVSEDPWSTATYTKGNTPVNVKKETSKSMCSKNMLKKQATQYLVERKAQKYTKYPRFVHMVLKCRDKTLMYRTTNSWKLCGAKIEVIVDICKY